MNRHILRVLILSSVFVSGLVRAADFTTTVDNAAPTINDTITVTVHASVPSGEAFVTASQFLAFDTTKLQLTTQAAGSATGFEPDARSLGTINGSGYGSGEIHAGLRSTVVISGEMTLGVFTFKAIAPGITSVTSAPFDEDLCLFGNLLTAANGTRIIPSTPADLLIDVNAMGIVTSVSGVSVPEGATASFGVKLSAPPAADVTVSVARTAGDTDITVAGGASLTFTVGNWSIYQAVTLAAAVDADTDNGSATITCSAAGMNSVAISAVEADTNTVLTVTASAGGTTVPSGATAAIMGVATDVAATPGAGHDFANWTIVSGRVNVADPNAAATTATINDPATIRANFATTGSVSILTNVAGLDVPETATATFRVWLSAAPAAAVTVAVARTAGDTDITVTGGASLTFTTANWNTYQTVTLGAAADPDTDDGFATITCSGTGVNSTTVMAFEADSITGGNVAPVAQPRTLSCLKDSYVAIVLTATDADSDPLTYTVVANPANGALSGGAPTLTYTPNTGYEGADSFTFKANDGAQDSNVATVTINVKKKKTSVPLSSSSGGGGGCAMGATGGGAAGGWWLVALGLALLAAGGLRRRLAASN